MNFVRAALVRGGTPYIRTAKYPPLSYLILESPIAARQLSRGSAVFSRHHADQLHFRGNFVLPPPANSRKRLTPELLLVFVTGLLSYGFQFELDRGQFNVIAGPRLPISLSGYTIRAGAERGMGLRALQPFGPDETLSAGLHCHVHSRLARLEEQP